MKIELGKDLEKASLPALAVFTFEEDAGKSGTASSLPAATQKKLAGLKSAGELSGREFECMLLHSPDGLDCERLLVIGAGKKEKFSGLLHRRVAGAAARFLRAKSMHEIGWVLEGDSHRPRRFLSPVGPPKESCWPTSTAKTIGPTRKRISPSIEW